MTPDATTPPVPPRPNAPVTPPAGASAGGAPEGSAPDAAAIAPAAPAEATVDALAAAGVLDALDAALARTLTALGGEPDPRVALGLGLASRALRLGDVCADLPTIAAAPVADDDGAAIAGLAWPPLAAWRAALAASPVVDAAGGRDATTPLVLDARAGRLYLRRMWRHEVGLAAALIERAAAPPLPLDGAALRQALATRFGPPGAAPDDQAVAAWVAAGRRLAIITGGPGTGKTTTVVTIAAILVDAALAAGAPPPRIALLAPTGKAAARLAEAVGEAGAGLALSDAARAALPSAARTIHRALGIGRDGRPSGRPLEADVVVVDEASMVDLARMRQLVDAVPAAARLVVLGDHDQLASVDAGAVLGDLCGGDAAGRHQAALADAYARFAAGDDAALDTASDGDAAGRPALAGSVVVLTRSRRFGADSGIGRLARAIRAGDADAVLAVLDDPAYPDAARRDGGGVPRGGRLAPALADAVQAGYGAVRDAAEPGEALDALASFRVVCAHRRGPYGVEPLNAAIAGALAAGGPGGAAAPPVEAIIVRHNDYAVGLYNGDIGLIAPRPGDGSPRAWFRQPDGALRELALGRLPAHEPAFALTVHQSQGSEFDTVAIVLPEAPSPLLTRELLYTAVTRARRRLTLFASADAVRHAVAQRTRRASGLRARLWGDEG